MELYFSFLLHLHNSINMAYEHVPLFDISESQTCNAVLKEDNSSKTGNIQFLNGGDSSQTC